MTADIRKKGKGVKFKNLPKQVKAQRDFAADALTGGRWLLTLLKKIDSDVPAESTVSSSIQLGLAKLLLGKLRPVWEPANPLRPCT